jgi:hypothetical protein
VKCCGIVANVSRGESLTCSNILHRFSDFYAVHDNGAPGNDILHREFMFCRNRSGKVKFAPGKRNVCAFLKINERHQHIIVGMKLQHLMKWQSRITFLTFGQTSL